MALILKKPEFDAFVEKVKKDPKLFFFTPSLMKAPLKGPAVEPVKYFKEDYARILQYIKGSNFVYIIPTASSSFHKILDRLKVKYHAAKPNPSKAARPDKELLAAFCQKISADKVIAFRQSHAWNEYLKVAQYDLTTSPYYSQPRNNNNNNRNSTQTNDVASFTEDSSDEVTTNDGKNDITSDEAFVLSQDPNFEMAGSHSQASNILPPHSNSNENPAILHSSDHKQVELPKATKSDKAESELEISDTDIINANDNDNVHSRTTNRRRALVPDGSQSHETSQTHNHNTNTLEVRGHPPHFTVNSPNSSPQSIDSATFDLDPFAIQPADKKFDPALEVGAFLSKNVSYSFLKDKKFKLFRDPSVRKDALKVYNILYYRYSTLNELASTVNLINLYMSSRQFFINLSVAMENSLKAGKSMEETLRVYNEERRIGFVALLDNIIMTGISFNMLYAMNFHELFEDKSSAKDPRSVIDIILSVFFHGRKQKEAIPFWWKWLVPKLLARTNQLKSDRVLDRKGNQLKKWNFPHFENRVIYHQVKYFSKRKSDHMAQFAGIHEKNSHGRKRQKEFHRSILSNSPPSPNHSDDPLLIHNPYLRSDVDEKKENDNKLEQQRLVFDEKLNQVTNDMNAKMDRMAHNLNNSGNRYAFSRFDSPQKKLLTLESHAISALVVDRTKDKEAAVYLADAVANEETRTHQDIIMEVMQRKMNGNKRAGTASNKELITKVEGLYL